MWIELKLSFLAIVKDRCSRIKLVVRQLLVRPKLVWNKVGLSTF